MSKRKSKKQVNNFFYDELNEKWLIADAHPIALLRAENRLRNPWILAYLKQHNILSGAVLDIGCGAGYLANTLARNGYEVNGIDISENTLDVACAEDITKSVRYLHGSALDLPYSEHSFDVVCAMDILEHVEQPERLIQEAARVLKPQGLLIFYTFNRTWQSYFLVIRAVETLVPNTPVDMHVFHLFLTLEEIIAMLDANKCVLMTIKGMRPCFNSIFWKSLLLRKILPDFSFCFTSNLSTGMLGVAQKVLF